MALIAKKITLQTETTCTLCTNDYYQRNWISGRTCKYPTFYFDLILSQKDNIQVSMWFPSDGDDDIDKSKIHQLFVISPNGRIIRSIKGNRIGKTKFQFRANMAGKYVLKYYLSTFWDEMYKIQFKSLGIEKNNPQTSIDCANSKIRVYSLLGAAKEGSKYKGEQLKEKCMERTIRQSNQRIESKKYGFKRQANNTLSI